MFFFCVGTLARGTGMAADVSNAQSNIKTNALRVQTISESKIFACGAFFVTVLLSALGGNIITFTAQYH